LSTAAQDGQAGRTARTCSRPTLVEGPRRHHIPRSPAAPRSAADPFSPSRRTPWGRGRLQHCIATPIGQKAPRQVARRAHGGPRRSIAEAQADAPFKSFWIALQAASALALSGALALNRKNGERRKLLSLALGFYVGTWASTAAYFAPEIIRLGRAGDEVAASEAERRAKRWQRLNWARLLALGAAWSLTAAALARKERRLAV
jgi:hypothetical protein